jgi:hypothetical protein
MAKSQSSRVGTVSRKVAKQPGFRSLGIVKKFFPQVAHVIDADSNAAIEVTPKDVRDSKRKNHSSCAMAVACRRARDLDGVIISIHTAYMIKGDTATRFTLPQSISREIVSFDRSGDFQPGQYYLSPPNPNSRLGAPRLKGGPSGGKSKGAYTPYHMTTNVRAVLGSNKVR